MLMLLGLLTPLLEMILSDPDEALDHWPALLFVVGCTVVGFSLAGSGHGSLDRLGIGFVCFVAASQMAWLWDEWRRLTRRGG